MISTQLLKTYSLYLLGGISTLSLIATSIYLRDISQSLNKVSDSYLPISEWAKLQNECIERTFRIDGNNTQGIPSKVWSCNGGGN